MRMLSSDRSKAGLAREALVLSVAAAAGLAMAWWQAQPGAAQAPEAVPAPEPSVASVPGATGAMAPVENPTANAAAPAENAPADAAPVDASPPAPPGDAEAARQAPAEAPGASVPSPSPEPTPEPTPAAPPQVDALGRRVHVGPPMPLSFKSAAVSELIPLIVEYTGKTVLPQEDVLARRVTVVSDRPLARDEALDLVFLALQQRGIAVVETPALVLLRDQTEVDRQTVPVIGPDESTLDRPDLGAVAQKVFLLRRATAGNVGEIVRGSVPDYARLAVDVQSNQILVTGPVALLQRLERLIDALDRPSADAVITETFHLRFADADQIATNIRELYLDTTAGRTQQQNQNVPAFFRQFQGGGGGAGGGGGGGGGQGGRGGQAGGGGTGASAQASTAATLRVTANRQQNSVTVLGAPDVVAKIRDQIGREWDRPLPEEAVVPRVFVLKFSDPIKIRDTLEGLFGTASTGTGGGGGGGGGAARGGQSQGVGRLAGQFSFQAIPESGQLVVVAKSPDNLAVIERIIDGLDQPRLAGLPRIVELKHANAEDLAEQLNALLAQEGTLAQVRRTETELTDADSSASPFASQADGAATQTQAQNQTQFLNFWWQRARVPTDSTGAGTIVGKSRIVPVSRQNALMVLAAPEFADSIVQLIQQLDRPGRQVLISAVIAELSTEDALALGLRVSSSAITPARQDNTVGLSPSTGQNGQPNAFISGQKQNLLPGLFDTSVLDIGVDLNALLQALAQQTDVSILSEPRIFTGDNQEATFFDGQDIPFITDSQTTDQGNLVQTFDYRAVGIELRVRPRITPQRDVDLKINLELSSIQPQQTLFGGFIVDRRETTTQLIVQDGQTVVVSGILRNEDSRIDRKVPLLGDIPLLGELFKSTENTRTTTELVAFITPIVVENPEESDAVNRDPRRRLGELREQLAPGQPGAASPAGEPSTAPAGGAEPSKGPAAAPDGTAPPRLIIEPRGPAAPAAPGPVDDPRPSRTGLD